MKRLVALMVVIAALGWIGSVLCVIVFSARDGATRYGSGSTVASASLPFDASQRRGAPYYGTSSGTSRVVDAIVVLGAAQYAGRPSPVLRARLDHAITLWRRGAARTLVLTGGTGTRDTTSEAVVGSAYARKRGVPETAIMLESSGRTTSESIHAVAALLRARRMRTVILVSDPFHMFRLWILARRVGLDPTTSPTRTSPIGASLATNAGYIFSESLKAPVVLVFERN